jgi:hypothetical protein
MMYLETLRLDNSRSILMTWTEIADCAFLRDTRLSLRSSSEAVLTLSGIRV